MESTPEIIIGLTDEQNKAVTHLRQLQRTKMFCGVSFGILIADFKEVNLLKNTDPVKASSNEKGLFNLCQYIPST